MSEYLRVFDEQCKAVKFAMADHYAKPFYDYTKGKWQKPSGIKIGQMTGMPTNDSLKQSDYISATSISLYGLGSSSKARDLYWDKNEHS